MPSFATDKKCCIIVGLGRGGIGDHIAKKFSAEGYNVAMVARSDLTSLEEQIPNSKSYICDAGNPEEVVITVDFESTILGSNPSERMRMIIRMIIMNMNAVQCKKNARFKVQNNYAL